MKKYLDDLLVILKEELQENQLLLHQIPTIQQTREYAEAEAVFNIKLSDQNATSKEIIEAFEEFFKFNLQIIDVIRSADIFDANINQNIQNGLINRSNMVSRFFKKLKSLHKDFGIAEIHQYLIKNLDFENPNHKNIFLTNFHQIIEAGAILNHHNIFAIAKNFKDDEVANVDILYEQYFSSSLRVMADLNEENAMQKIYELAFLNQDIKHRAQARQEAERLPRRLILTAQNDPKSRALQRVFENKFKKNLWHCLENEPRIFDLPPQAGSLQMASGEGVFGQEHRFR